MKPKIIQKLQAQLNQPLPYASDNKKFELLFANKFKQNSPRRCAVLMVLFPDGQHFSTIFMLRPDDGAIHAGQISFPGGGEETQDQTLCHTALRETEEEIGLKVYVNDVIGSLSDIYIRPSHALVKPYVAFLAEKPNHYLPNPNEVQKVIELQISDFLNIKNHTSHDLELPNGRKVKFPAYDIHRYHIWGATARMMQEFLCVWKAIHA